MVGTFVKVSRRRGLKVVADKKKVMVVREGEGCCRCDHVPIVSTIPLIL